MNKIIFEGKIKATTSWEGTSIQTKEFKDKFGKIRIGESRAFHVETE